MREARPCARLGRVPASAQRGMTRRALGGLAARMKEETRSSASCPASATAVAAQATRYANQYGQTKATDRQQDLGDDATQSPRLCAPSHDPPGRWPHNCVQGILPISPHSGLYLGHKMTGLSSTFPGRLFPTAAGEAAVSMASIMTAPRPLWLRVVFCCRHPGHRGMGSYPQQIDTMTRRNRRSRIAYKGCPLLGTPRTDPDRPARSRRGQPHRPARSG
jgi:hypothetical protein